jgi:hypothetical protein
MTGRRDFFSERPSEVAGRASGVAGQGDWAWGVGVYLALSSAGAGAYIVSQLAGLADVSWNPAARAGAGLGIALVMIGALVVMFDLGRWTRFYRAASRPGASWESRAFLLIVAFSTLGCLQIAGWAWDYPWSAWLSIPVGALALALLLYGAVLLRGMRAYVLWRHPLQLALIPAGGLLAGCGVLAIDPLGTLAPAHFRALGVAIALLAITKSVLLSGLLLQTARAGAAGRASVDALLVGPKSRLFGAGAIGLGLALPALLGALVGAGWVSAPLLRVAGAAALVGLVIFRHAFLVAAHRPTQLTFRGAGPWGMSRQSRAGR